MTDIKPSVPLAAPDPAERARFVTPTIQAMQGSLILQIAGQVRARIAAGEPVCNLTVGDFDARRFPIPSFLRDRGEAAVLAGHTAYPPPEGIPELRRAIAAWYSRELGISIGPEWVIVASGARPVMYGTARMFLEPGDGMAFAVPSWNNGYYAQLTGARPLPIPTLAENNFFPTPDQLRAVLPQARLFTLNSPLNPTGTVISPGALKAIAEVVLEENLRRAQTGARPLMWMWDQVYWQLCFAGSAHAHPCALVPEVAPWVVTVDAISKMWAATGLRVGWAVMAPMLAERMGALIGHVGAWAPRPWQMASADLLNDDAARAQFLGGFRAGLQARLERLSAGLTRLGVPHLQPQGAMYLSVRFQRAGMSNEQTRRWLLEGAGVAVVPFQAFDLPEDSGWFRMSVGAISLEDIDAMFLRLERLLSRPAGG